jgi:hypothetical protein
MGLDDTQMSPKSRSIMAGWFCPVCFWFNYLLACVPIAVKNWLAVFAVNLLVGMCELVMLWTACGRKDSRVFMFMVL